MGYKLAGYKELLAIDFDQNAVDVFKLNFPAVPVWYKDITQITPAEILGFCRIVKGDLDVLDGSPPCQGFSNAGKKRVNDSRNTLFKSFVDLIDGLQPRVFVMENVRGMCQGPMKGLFIEIIKTLKSLNYTVKCRLLNTKHYDVPQSRERLIFMGVRKDLGIDPIYPTPKTRVVTVRGALQGVDNSNQEIRQLPAWMREGLQEITSDSFTTDPMEKMFLKYKGSTGGAINTQLLAWHRPSCTLMKTEIGASGIIHPYKHRYLTLAEYKRLSTFPDDFQFTDRKTGVERIGNSVPPRFMFYIANTIKEEILLKT